MFSSIYNNDTHRSWAMFNCFCAMIIAFYGNSIYFFIHSSSGDDPIEEK